MWLELKQSAATRRWLAAMLLLAACLPVLATAQQLTWGPGSTPITIADLNAQFPDGLRVGDKVFSNFTVVTTATVGITAPDDTTIKVGGTFDFANLGVIGLDFYGGWAAGVGELINSTIDFDVTADAPFLISGVALNLNAFSALGDGLVQLTENVTDYDAPPNQLVLPPLFANYQNGGPLNQTYVQANILALYGPQQAIHVTKDLTVRDGASINPGAAHLSNFSQGFFQVPEPGTISLILAGATLMVLRRKTA